MLFEGGFLLEKLFPSFESLERNLLLCSSASTNSNYCAQEHTVASELSWIFQPASREKRSNFIFEKYLVMLKVENG